MLAGARKDPQLVTSEWAKIQKPIEGVVIREVLHVPRDHGIITETYRPEWDPSGLPVVHVYQSRLFPAAIGAWSCHMRTIDRLFVNQGHLKVVLYDGREESSTHGQLMELHGDVLIDLTIEVNHVQAQGSRAGEPPRTDGRRNGTEENSAARCHRGRLDPLRIDVCAVLAIAVLQP